MKIITKYYDKKGKLRALKDKSEDISPTIRFKKLKNGKDFLAVILKENVQT